MKSTGLNAIGNTSYKITAFRTQLTAAAGSSILGLSFTKSFRTSPHMASFSSFAKRPTTSPVANSEFLGNPDQSDRLTETNWGLFRFNSQLRKIFKPLVKKTGTNPFAGKAHVLQESLARSQLQSSSQVSFQNWVCPQE